jgi:hypothetical protein
LRNAYRIAVGNAERKSQAGGGGRATPKLDDNIKIYLK